MERLPGARRPRRSPAEPELVDRASRRRFTAEYKLWILRKADTPEPPGEIGAALRRKRLHTSFLI